MRTPRLALALLLVAMLHSSAFARVEVRDATFGFSFELPVGFVNSPQGKNAPGIPAGDIVQCYVRPGIGKDTVGTVMVVKRLHGTLGDQPSSLPAQLNNGRTLDLSDEKWKSRTLQVNRLSESAGGTALVTFNVQVPLAPEAIQISVSGLAAHEKRNRALIKTILASLHGDSTWSGGGAAVKPVASQPPAPLNAEERGERFATGVLQFCFCVGLAGLVVLMIINRRRTRLRGAGSAAPPGQKTANRTGVEAALATPLGARIMGLVALAFSGAIYVVGIQQPLAEAQHNHPSVSLASKGVLLLPLLAAAGIVLLIFGAPRAGAAQQATKAKKIAAIAIVIALVIAGIALDIWLRSKLRAQGYDA